MADDVLAKDPCRTWRLHIATSPGLQIIGTASGSRSEPPFADTSPLMSILPSLCVPGTTQSPLAGVLPYSCTMKLKPWVPSSRSGLSQCVVPSWCQATDAPSPGCFTHILSLNGVKSGPLICSAIRRRSGWPYSRTAESISCRTPDMCNTTSSGASPGTSGSIIFASYLPPETGVPP